jgi:hypothetical protein
MTAEVGAHCGDLEGLIVALERDEQVTVDCEDSTGSRHLQHQISVVRDSHELGQHGAT